MLAAAARYGAPEDADAVVLEDFVHIDIDSSAKMTQTTRMVTHVLRLQGIASTRQVSIGWVAWRENRPKIKARVITSDGKAHMLEEASITDVEAPASTGAPPQTHVLTAILPAVDYDSVIEMEAEESDRETLYPGGRWGEIRLDSRNPIFHFSLDISSHMPFPLGMYPRGFVDENTRLSGVMNHVSFEASRITAAREEILLPPDVPPSPVITFSNVKSWQEVAQWCAERFSTNAPVLANAFGDSEKKAVALIAKLKAQGIAAKPALIRAAPSLEILPNQRGLEAFNRVLVYVPGEKPRWVDPTVENAAGQLPVADQWRWALIADAATTELVRTPEATAEENRRVDITEIRLQDGPPAKVKTTIDAHGAFEEALDTEDAQHKTQREMTSDGYAGSLVGDAGGFIDLPGLAGVQFQRLGPLVTADGEGEAARKVDYWAFPPFSEESRFHVTLPVGFRFSKLPTLQNVGMGPLTLSAADKLESDGSLTVVYSLVSPKDRYTPQEGAAIGRDAAKKLADKGVLRILFVNTGEEMLANGKAKEGLELLKQNAGTSTNATLRVADGYVAAGERAEAVKVCREVIAKEPKNAAAYVRLGWVYAHDESGRLYAEGMDQAEAEKAFQKAIELKPDERPYLVQLATAETYNACGIRFGKGAQLADAINAYSQAGLKALVATRSLNDFAGSLLFAGRYQDVRQFYMNPEADGADPAIKIAAIAASGDAGDAIEEASFLPFAPKVQREVLAHAAHYLLIAREYGPAVELDPSDARLRRTKRFEASAVSADPAIAAIERFIEAVLNPATPEEWKKFVAPNATTAIGDYRTRLLKLYSASGKTPESIDWPYIADVLTSALDFKSEQSGDQYTILAGTKPIAHVVKRGDEFLVADLVP